MALSESRNSRFVVLLSISGVVLGRKNYFLVIKYLCTSEARASKRKEPVKRDVYAHVIHHHLTQA